MQASKTRLTLAFAAIYLVWGSTYLGIRVAVEGLPPFLMASLRFVVAGSTLLSFLAIRERLTVKWHQLRDNAFVGGCLLLGGNGLVSWAEQYIPSGIAALIIGSQPLIIVLTEWLWPGGHRPRLLVLGALLLGLAGVAWLAAPWDRTSEQTLHLGAVLAIVSACIAWAIGSIYGRHAKDPASPFLSAALQMLFGSLGLALVAALRGEWQSWIPSATPTTSWVALAYLILVGSLVGFSSFVWLMKNSTPAKVSTYAYVNPVVAVFLGWLILDEPVSHRTLIGSAIIIGAVIIVTTQKNLGTRD